MTMNDATPVFSGIYLTPDTYLGSDRAATVAFLAHLRQLTRPATAEEHLLVREWAMIQSRLQGLQQMELDWWTSYELAMEASMGETSVGDVDAVAQLQVCNRAIAAFERLVRLEARFKKRELQLLPLMEALLARAEAPVAVGKGSDDAPAGEDDRQANADHARVGGVVAQVRDNDKPSPTATLDVRREPFDPADHARARGPITPDRESDRGKTSQDSLASLQKLR